jgi:hypothetical protein
VQLSQVLGLGDTKSAPQSWRCRGGNSAEDAFRALRVLFVRRIGTVSAVAGDVPEGSETAGEPSRFVDRHIGVPTEC